MFPDSDREAKSAQPEILCSRVALESLIKNITLFAQEAMNNLHHDAAGEHIPEADLAHAAEVLSDLRIFSAPNISPETYGFALTKEAAQGDSIQFATVIEMLEEERQLPGTEVPGLRETVSSR